MIKNYSEHDKRVMELCNNEKEVSNLDLHWISHQQREDRTKIKPFCDWEQVDKALQKFKMVTWQKILIRLFD